MGSKQSMLAALSRLRGMRIGIAAFGALLLGAASPAGTAYAIDNAGSSVSAKVSFLGIGKRTAGFPQVSGTVRLSPDRPDSIALDVKLDARALTASDGLTRDRLRGEDFFWVAKYPVVRFRGDQLTMRSATSGTVRGQLQARGVSRPVVLNVTFDKAPANLAPDESVTLSGSTTINRRDFGMTAYSLIVGKKVMIDLTAKLRPRR